MAYHADANSNLARAKEAAEKLVRESGSGDVFTVIQMNESPNVFVGPAAIDHASVAAKINAIEASQTAADLDSVVSLINEAINEASRAKQTTRPTHVYFLTDLQRGTWQAIARAKSDEATTELKAEQGSASFKELTDKAAFTLFDLGQTSSSNLAVTHLGTSVPYVTTGDEVSLDATLHQFGNDPRPNCTVQLLIDGNAVAERVVDVPAQGDATVQFNHRFTTAGDHQIHVQAAPDRLALDNARWLVVPVRSELRVLCVAGHDGAAKYVADALNPNPDTAGSPIRPVSYQRWRFRRCNTRRLRLHLLLQRATAYGQ